MSLFLNFFQSLSRILTLLYLSVVTERVLSFPSTSATLSQNGVGSSTSRSYTPQGSSTTRALVPLKVLGETVSKQFAGDPSEAAAKAVSEAASSVIETAKRSIGDVREEFEAPADPIECIRLLVEKAANTFLGVDEGGKYTPFAWTLRKITREYIEVLYPPLKDEEKRRSTFSILGVRELYRPSVRSPIANRLTILGYPDYAFLARVEEWGDTVTLSILPAREKTLRGALCRLR
jgi:hypothetical protein